MKYNKAFTLIELLVVVLIIGILAAVALPQYKKAVIKTRYATIKGITHSIASAEQVYFMENGTYTTDFEKLSITFGEKKYDTNVQRYFPWGYCSLSGASAEDVNERKIYCRHESINIGYGIHLATEKRACYASNDETVRAVCRQETNNATPIGAADTPTYIYP